MSTVIDRQYAKALDISCAEAILFRSGAKQLSPQMVAFCRHLDTLDKEGWQKVESAYSIASTGNNLNAPRNAAASASARDIGEQDEMVAQAVRQSTVERAWTGSLAAVHAMREIAGGVSNTFFLNMFFDDVPGWLAAHGDLA